MLKAKDQILLKHKTPRFKALESRKQKDKSGNKKRKHISLLPAPVVCILFSSL